MWNHRVPASPNPHGDRNTCTPQNAFLSCEENNTDQIETKVGSPQKNHWALLDSFKFLHEDSKTVFGIDLGPLKIETLTFGPMYVKWSLFGVA